MPLDITHNTYGRHDEHDLREQFEDSLQRDNDASIMFGMRSRKTSMGSLSIFLCNIETLYVDIHIPAGVNLHLPAA